MRRFFILASMFITVMAFVMAAPASAATEINRQGKTFTQVKVEGSKGASKGTPTEYTYAIGDKTYPVYLTKRNFCFIWKVSGKTGNEYRYYLQDSIQDIIRAEMNLKVIPKKSEQDAQASK